MLMGALLVAVLLRFARWYGGQRPRQDQWKLVARAAEEGAERDRAMAEHLSQSYHGALIRADGVVRELRRTRGLLWEETERRVAWERWRASAIAPSRAVPGATSRLASPIRSASSPATARLDCPPDHEARLNATLNLLAVIHRDGGHHTERVGVLQSLADAQALVPKERGDVDRQLETFRTIRTALLVRIDQLKEEVQRLTAVAEERAGAIGRDIGTSIVAAIEHNLELRESRELAWGAGRRLLNTRATLEVCLERLGELQDAEIENVASRVAMEQRDRILTEQNETYHKVHAKLVREAARHKCGNVLRACSSRTRSRSVTSRCCRRSRRTSCVGSSSTARSPAHLSDPELDTGPPCGGPRTRACLGECWSRCVAHPFVSAPRPRRRGVFCGGAYHHHRSRRDRLRLRSRLDRGRHQRGHGRGVRGDAPEHESRRHRAPGVPGLRHDQRAGHSRQ
jgi:hypothetical protein